MIKILLTCFCLGCSGLLFAGNSSTALSTLTDTAGLQEPPVFEATSLTKTAYLPQSLTWLASLQELYSDGGLQFDYAGRKYSVKLGFDRGEYDSYIKNYKSVPGIIFTDITDPNSFSVWDFQKLADIRNVGASFTLNDNNVVTLYFDGASVLIRNKSGANVVSIGYNSLSSAWGENAKKYSKCYGTNMEYFVPQAYSIKPTFMYGYVVSEYAPFYPNSGLPLDFINLYKTGTTYEYKPMAYSIPLGLSFKYLGAQGQPWTWTVNNLTQEDLQAALADELRGVKLGISVQDGRPAVAVQNK